MGSPSESASVSALALAMPPTPDGGASVHITKRDARTCTHCRKGRASASTLVADANVESVLPSTRVAPSSAAPHLAPLMLKPPSPLPQRRLSHLEGQYLVMQSQMIGMQSSLDRILSAIENQALVQGGPAYPPPGAQQRRDPHTYATYGIMPSTAPSSDDESEDTLSPSTLTAPIEALQDLAKAAAKAAVVPSTQPPWVKKRKRADPTSRNAFPYVVGRTLAVQADQIYLPTA
ncbi:uncharacterized protein TRAVEDRAFT_48143 [Trametes versicolor FP-101664 SS1]|uniref:uncharacterized protein n=1 Tax=Trametes versicolor (strain FP-101664) TaxID=717944 RepID=UPI0004623B55|nr:uncharacterized protein TRAVEDRAFT_48143 [Trametes versicolor FP-101664 SS1]EIW59016.1 hypothetical protein TRAVEDRAFT_48143 [Trametes versicolor FP-101664 SS1]